MLNFQRNIVVYGEFEEKLLTFLKKEWPLNTLRWNKEHWIWKFKNNPILVEGTSNFYVYVQEGSILGCVGLIPVRLKVGDKEIMASWVINLMRDEEYRGKGIGLFLIKKCIDSGKNCIAFGMTNASFKVFKKLGWVELEIIPTYILVLNPFVKLKNSKHNFFKKFIFFLFWSFWNSR
ncbi:GNAT family N-acetyltransferase [Chlamydiota bacterium]